MNLAEVRELLRDATLFAMLSPEEGDGVAKRCEVVRFTLGQTIYRSEEPADAFYVVSSGRVRVISETAEPGTAVTVGTLTRGDFFGEEELLTGVRRRYTARAAGDVLLLRLPREEFERLAG